MTGMKILISGAGIAGNALAFWLSKLGHDVTVIERFPNLRTNGLQIDLRGHGVEVLRRMGLEQVFRARSIQEQGIQVVDSSNRRRAYFPANKSGKGVQSLTTEFEIMRGDLCRLLHDATKDRARYIFGTSVESFEEKHKSVEVRLADGKTHQFDLWIGADGQGSRTRKMMLGPDADDGFIPLNGMYTGYFTTPRPIREGEEYIATAYMAPGKRGFMTRRHSPHAMQVYMGCTTESERLKKAVAQRGDVKEEKEALAEIFQGAGWQTEELLESLRADNDFYLERIGLVKLDSWSRGLVALVGDAAYCPSVNTGMGTTSGIVGAYILAGEIGSHCGGSFDGKDGGYEAKDGLVEALEAYELKFKPFMDQVTKGLSGDSGAWTYMMPSTPLGITVFNFVIGIVSFLRLDVLAKYVLREDAVKGWDLPEYEELLRD
ncbi:hypothetical protein BJ170DRAFT_463368 [Xylariales sp. AK1849]|nr:hypothetical protein BJ170DRAFT_463368 [Xylariales sp. AK1849]